jgi:hypothetical protein
VCRWCNSRGRSSHSPREALTVLLGWLFLVSGIVGLGFWWSLISAIVNAIANIVAGAILLASPMPGTLTLIRS